MVTFLTVITCLAALVFLAVVAIALVRIAALLENTGGRGDSYLAKLRLGLRAIERETSHLPASVPGLNQNLSAIAGGLTSVDEALGEARKAFLAQGDRS